MTEKKEFRLTFQSQESKTRFMDALNTVYDEFMCNRFVTDFSKVNFVNKVEREITFRKKLKIGDIVKLKNSSDYTIAVEYIDFEIPDVGKVDYAGHKVENPSERLILFNQNDIDYKVKTP